MTAEEIFYAKKLTVSENYRIEILLAMEEYAALKVKEKENEAIEFGEFLRENYFIEQDENIWICNSDLSFSETKDAYKQFTTPHSTFEPSMKKP
jgi:hypothetical protein